MDKMPDEIWANEHECWGERADTWPNAPQVKYVRAALNQPRPPKIDGLEMLFPLAKEFMNPERHLDRHEAINISREARQGFQDFLEKYGIDAAARVQLAAQEGGCLAESASDVILGEYFDLENTERDKNNV